VVVVMIMVMVMMVMILVQNLGRRREIVQVVVALVLLSHALID
jgi:hypothetical protein